MRTKKRGWIPRKSSPWTDTRLKLPILRRYTNTVGMVLLWSKTTFINTNMWSNCVNLGMAKATGGASWHLGDVIGTLTYDAAQYQRFRIAAIELTYTPICTNDSAFQMFICHHSTGDLTLANFNQIAEMSQITPIVSGDGKKELTFRWMPRTYRARQYRDCLPNGTATTQYNTGENSFGTIAYGAYGAPVFVNGGALVEDNADRSVTLGNLTWTVVVEYIGARNPNTATTA